MKISLMQKIDFFVGVPVLFFLSIFIKVKRLFLRGKEVSSPSQIRNILFIELSEMGSMVFIRPLIGKVEKAYPGARIYFLTFASTAPALRILQLGIAEDRVLTLRAKNLLLFIWDFIRVSIAISAIGFDITFDLELFSRVSSLLSVFSRARQKIGFDNFFAEGLYRGDFLTHRVTYNTHQHIAKNFLGMFYALEEKPGDIPHAKKFISDEEIYIPCLEYKSEIAEKFRTRLYSVYPSLRSIKTIIIFNPNSSQSMPLRRWPMESYLALAQRLVSLPETAIVIMGAPNEKADAEFLCTRLQHPNIIDLSGFTNLEELMALYNMADLLISNDSGPSQFSALTHLKTIAFYGPETPHLYGPLNPNAYSFFKNLQCSPCYSAYNQRRSPCTNNVCLQSITIDEVFDKAIEMLAIP